MGKILEIRDLLQANVRASEGAGTTTLVAADARHQIFNLSAARTVVLPSAGIIKGEKVVLENTGAFDLSMQSSDLTALTRTNVGGGVDPTIRVGYTVMLALQDAPTAPAHWRVLECEETISYTVSIVSGFSGGQTCTAIVKRRMNLVSNTLRSSGSTTGTGAVNIGLASHGIGRLSPAALTYAGGGVIGTNQVGSNNVEGGFFAQIPPVGDTTWSLNRYAQQACSGSFNYSIPGTTFTYVIA